MYPIIFCQFLKKFFAIFFLVRWKLGFISFIFRKIKKNKYPLKNLLYFF